MLSYDRKAERSVFCVLEEETFVLLVRFRLVNTEAAKKRKGCN
jgi:hypothetical protein